MGRNFPTHLPIAMTPRNATLCLFFTFGLGACAFGPGVKPGLPDSLTVQFNNDSDGMMLTRGGAMYTYANARCQGGERQAYKFSMEKQESLATVPLTPGKPLTFALSTSNAQSFKGNWGCSVTSTFTPAQGKHYLAILKTEGDNRSCKITIMDQHYVPVPASSPEYSCDKTLAGTVKNGERWHSSPPIVPLYLGK